MPVQVDPHVLVHCAAVVVAHDDFDTQALISLGEKCGFGAVSDFNHVTDAWRAHPLLFVLVHFGIGAEAKRKLLDRVRHAGSVNICFAPTILFLQNATQADTVEFLDMGFDDVICLPEDSLVLSTRLASQIGQEHIFIETRNYLGPDRPHAGHGHAADIEHANLRILRTPGHGVQVLHREVVHKHH